ncbi:hypothetical protein BJ138DRAFT_1115472 [Hygrophoropsis aurantiaca]|uniref:Uncharacterized protein n=1 Tax=Hygrophoropsis aurantiaca TaxID=72124 RepID=A0ACB8A725_9AGAM|nr:hypothetical protein BJ138DRAFT_1115472 [Hygrophoropsis aurantiaca]
MPPSVRWQAMSSVRKEHNMTSGRYYHLAQTPTCVAISSPATLPSPSLTLNEFTIIACTIDAYSRVTLSERSQNQSEREAGQVTFSMLASAAV